MDGTAPGGEQDRERNLGRTIFRNTIAASIGSWFTRIANFLFIIFAVRILGEVDLGRYATIVAFVGLFSVFSELGLAQYVERSIAQDHHRATELFWNLTILRALLGFGGIVGISLLAFGTYDREIALGVFIFSLTFLLSAAFVPLSVVLTANERFDLSTAINMIGQLVTVGLGFGLLWVGLGIYALLLTGFVAMPLQIAAAIWVLRHSQLGPPRFRIDTRSWRNLIRASLPFGITSLALTLNFNVDTVILGLFRSDAEVGWYNASYRLVFNAVNVAGVFLLVMTPSIAREHRLSPERVKEWVRTSIYWMIVVAVPAGAGLSMIASDVVRFLYGDTFAPAALVVAIIAWDIPLYFLLAFFGNVTAATNRERPAAAIYVFSATLNVILNFLFIPLYGRYAAASITVVSDLLTVGMFFILLRATTDFHPRFTGVVARVGVATSMMAVVLWIVAGLPMLAKMGIGALAYFGLAILLKLINIPQLVAVLRTAVRHSRPWQGAT